MSGVFYNDNEPYVCEWLRNLIAAGHLPEGEVDGRDIREVTADDLEGYEQAHFFGGVGGWPYALKLAGWNGPVWTGSCPCQPFSTAGKRKAEDDSRHLWPAWLRLIRECRPDTIFGEQVEGAVGFGWLDRVFADLEAEGYACGAAVLGAHSVGAPHIRQRLWWVAYASGERCGEAWSTEDRRGLGGGSTHGRMGNASGAGLDQRECDGRVQQETVGAQPGQTVECRGNLGFWSAHDLIPCADGKARRIEPGTFPLAHGVPNRVGRLRAYGNAIVPQVAAEFVKAFMETQEI